MSINIECLSIWRAPRALGLAKLVTPNTNIDTRALMTSNRLLGEVEVDNPPQ